ncbi:MAG: FliI/YscN family ATPase [Polyangiaceae bacterium]
MLDLRPYIARVKSSPGPSPEGRVHEVVGLLVEVVGMSAATGQRLEVSTPRGPLIVEVMGFRRGVLLCAPLGSTAGVEPGALVRRRTLGDALPAGDGLLGRVLDAFGAPLDELTPARCAHRVPLVREPPPSYGRKPITQALETGVRVLDALLPLGRGQRVGLFAGTGVGKSTLLGMLCRRAKADVIVVGLIGERGREVGDFVRHALGKEGLARSVVVAATSDKAPLVRVQGALAATAIAEHFRDLGKNVLLVMDSVTRFAMALREVSLAAGEPPVTKGYTPSVFAALPTLLERTGNTAGEGSITAIYTVLVEGDDLGDPIADAVRGILDGHIVLSRSLAERGVYPAVDVLKSVSRVFEEITQPDHKRVAIEVRGALGTYRETADLVRIGAYVAGSDPRVDAAVRAAPRIESALKQRIDEPSTRADALRVVSEALRGPAPQPTQRPPIPGPAPARGGPQDAGPKPRDAPRR